MSECESGVGGWEGGKIQGVALTRNPGWHSNEGQDAAIQYSHVLMKRLWGTHGMENTFFVRVQLASNDMFGLHSPDFLQGFWFL